MQKMSIAQFLLRNGSTVSEVQERLNYSSYAYFFKTFQKENKYAQLWKSDTQLRMNVSLYGTLIFNTAMIRRRIRDTSLTVQYLNVGSSSRTDLALVYMADKADQGYVKELTAKLQNLKTDSLTLGHRSVAECLIRSNWYNPFPKIRTTERPDSAAASILEGSVLLLCDNSPEAMIFPTSIFDFLEEADDFYFPPLTGTYLRVLRHCVFWLTVILTPTWYLLLGHPEWVPPWLSMIFPAMPSASSR